MADAKALRRYQAGVERALALFDASNEWADYIAFLSRLFKALQGPPENADIPVKSTVARYLAQCLRPSLPSGVHQKALEVYDTIFTTIGKQRLGSDLTIYLPGISHTLSFASLSTRPQFLAIYDDHVLALPTGVLRPAIKALIMSLLPGIEEETSEDFERTLGTFNRLREKFAADKHEEIFWQNLFLASVTSPNRRGGVLVYLIRYLPKLESQSSDSIDTAQSQAESAKAITTPEPGLLARCFATGLQDLQPLVQRGFLDLLVSHVPLDATIFANDAHSGDLDVLVNASATVVLRRDMGLNRRLWAWYTGSERKMPLTYLDGDVEQIPTSPTDSRTNTHRGQYFSEFGLASLIRSMSLILKQDNLDAVHRARPFRIALSLMDRWEIGGPVVESQFVPLLKSLQLYQATAPSQEAFDEVFRSANVFFDGVESKVIATQLLLLITEGDLDLVTFIVNNFNLEEEEMVKVHIPSICLVIVESIQSELTKSNTSAHTEELSKALKLGQILEDLLVLVPVGVLNDVGEDERAVKKLGDDVLSDYLGNLSTVNGSGQKPMLSDEAISGALIKGVCDSLQQCTTSPAFDSDLLARLMASLDQCLALTTGFRTLQQMGFSARLLHIVQSPVSGKDGRHYQTITGITSLIATLRVRDPSNKVLRSEDLCTLVPLLIENLWYFLLTSKPQYHVEAVESIWRLHALSRPLRLAESTIISLLVDGLTNPDLRDQCMQRFGTLWIHSRLALKQLQGQETESRGAGGDDVLDLLQYPLLQVIDAIDTDMVAHPCSAWLKQLTSLNTLFGLVFQQMPKDMTDSSRMGLSLQRLSKLVSIAKTNEAQWKAFSGKTGHREAVFELCSSLTSNQAVVDSLGVEALNIVRILISYDDIELDEDILRMLSTRLVASYEMTNFQDALLATLQAAYSSSKLPTQPDYLIPILLEGISSMSVDAALDKWITLLCTVVPLLRSSTLFSNLLKITNCLCKRVDAYFRVLQNSYITVTKTSLNDVTSLAPTAINPERSISNLLSGLEYVIARAHHQALLPQGEQDPRTNNSTMDILSSRSSANDHLTVILCMQDALKACSSLWLWRSAGKITLTTVDTKSLHYMASRLRARSRRILENLVEAEPQECLETLMGLWVERRYQNSHHSQILELLQTLDGARPKFMMPATFNAIYNRTNPAALDQSQKSSLSVNVNAFELIAFLNDYTSALEDDLLDEIWTDCTTFLKEILSNPLPHRQILFKLLEFMSVLCRKMENTNFGEESRMRKELADLCVRLFTAIFTIKPLGLDGSGVKSLDIDVVFDRKQSLIRSSVQASNPLQILQDTLPDLSLVLSPSDRLVSIYSGIASNVTGPILRARIYPQNISAEFLALLQTMATAPAATKSWRKDVLDAFNDNKFFQNQVQLAERGWLPLIKQLMLADKTLVFEQLSRITPPAAAGLMFGVGATAARTEADKKTQAALRRVALMMLSVENDYFVPNLSTLLTKLEELLSATPESSPSSNTRTDVYLTLRTILLTFSASQLPSLWPLIDAELRDLCAAMITKDLAKYTTSAQLQGAKVLDLLLLMKPDEFQLHEWLFVTDTMDAIYPPPTSQPIALADQIVRDPSLGSMDSQSLSAAHLRKPWLCTSDSRDESKTEALLSAFFAHLSIRTFEESYNLQRLDIAACREDLIYDLFCLE